MALEFVQFSVVKLYRTNLYSGYTSKRPEDYLEKGCLEVVYAVYIDGEYYSLGSSKKSLMFPNGHNTLVVRHD